MNTYINISCFAVQLLVHIPAFLW